MASQPRTTKTTPPSHQLVLFHHPPITSSAPVNPASAFLLKHFHTTPNTNQRHNRKWRSCSSSIDSAISKCGDEDIKCGCENASKGLSCVATPSLSLPSHVAPRSLSPLLPYQVIAPQVSFPIPIPYIIHITIPIPIPRSQVHTNTPTHTAASPPSAHPTSPKSATRPTASTSTATSLASPYPAYRSHLHVRPRTAATGTSVSR